MKKSTKSLLIFAVILLLAGGSLVFYALYSANFDWNKLTVKVENETFDYSVVGIIRDVDIQSRQVNVRVLPSSNATCTVRAKIASRTACTAENADGLLTVTCDQKTSKPWYDIWRQDETELTVFLPDHGYDHLKITSDSADVYVSDALSFASAGVKTTSGDQEFYAPVSDKLALKTSSGDVTLMRTGCKTLSLESSSGEIICGECRSETVTVSSASGDISLDKCALKNVQISTGSGDISLAQTNISQQLDVSSSSGEIEFLHSTAESMQITAKSGDVSGILVEPMLFDVRSDSGDVVLPASGGTHRCTVRTGSGDVHFTMQDS